MVIPSVSMVRPASMAPAPPAHRILAAHWSHLLSLRSGASAETRPHERWLLPSNAIISLRRARHHLDHDHPVVATLAQSERARHRALPGFQRREMGGARDMEGDRRGGSIPVVAARHRPEQSLNHVVLQRSSPIGCSMLLYSTSSVRKWQSRGPLAKARHTPHRTG